MCRNKQTVLADEPLRTPEQDRLGFASFAEGVASVIKHMEVKESVVFAVYGKWGSGKTTFLNFLTHYLSGDDLVIIVRFNPWWFSGKEKLLLQFFSNLSKVLGRSDKLKEVVSKLKLFLRILKPLPYVKNVSEAIDAIVDATSQTLEKTKEEICEYLKKLENKIVVLIDDIDRLTAEEIRELFTIVKAIGDFPNTVYILAFDKEVVSRALEKVQEGKGEEYLEKIVQVPIELPLIDKISIRKILFEELDTVLAGTPNELFDSTYWGNVYWDGIDPFISTVRDVKRLTNAVRITYPSVKGEVNAVDFIAIEALRVFCPEVYTVIRNNPNMFCGHSESSIYTGSHYLVESLKQFHEGWLSNLSLSDNLKRNIKDLLKRLFPKLEGVFGNVHYEPEWERGWRKKCRVCSKEVFPRFFTFSVPSDDLSRHEVETILASLAEGENFSKHLKDLSTQIRRDGSTKVSVFLERMEDYTFEIPQDHIPAVVETFFNVGDELIIPEDESKGFFIPWGNDIRMGRIIWQLLERYDEKDKRFEILKSAFEKGQAISMMVKEMTTFWQQHGKYGGTKKPDEDVLLEEKHLEALQGIVLNKIREISRDDKLLNTPILPSVLYRWKEWGDEAKVRDWVKKIVSSDEKLPIFLSKFLQKTRSAGMNDRVARIRWRLNPNWLKELVDLNLLEKRCVEILSNKEMVSKLDDIAKLAISRFLKEKYLLDEGKNPDDSFFTEELDRNENE